MPVVAAPTVGVSWSDARFGPILPAAARPPGRVGKLGTTNTQKLMAASCRCTVVPFAPTGADELRQSSAPNPFESHQRWPQLRWAAPAQPPSPEIGSAKVVSAPTRRASEPLPQGLLVASLSALVRVRGDQATRSTHLRRSDWRDSHEEIQVTYPPAPPGNGVDTAVSGTDAAGHGRPCRSASCGRTSDLPFRCGRQCGAPDNMAERSPIHSGRKDQVRGRAHERSSADLCRERSKLPAATSRAVRPARRERSKRRVRLICHRRRRHADMNAALTRRTPRSIDSASAPDRQATRLGLCERTHRGGAPRGTGLLTVVASRSRHRVADGRHDDGDHGSVTKGRRGRRIARAPWRVPDSSDVGHHASAVHRSQNLSPMRFT